MGTKCAPNYAIFFMEEIEEKLLPNYQMKPHLWKCYIDDIFMIWQYGPAELKKFLDYLNSAHSTIKFTEEYSNEGLPFLDTFIFIENNCLLTKVNHEATDNKHYLH